MKNLITFQLDRSMVTLDYSVDGWDKKAFQFSTMDATNGVLKGTVTSLILFRFMLSVVTLTNDTMTV